VLILIVRSISVLTINEEVENERDLVKIIEDARSYFPSETWDDIRYLGKLSLEHDIKIATGGKPLGAFLFERLVERIKKLKDSDKLMSLLLGITPDPIVAVYYFFDGTHFKRALYLVHDYVAEKIGVVSLFQVNEEYFSKVVAHGLGHNRGLRHHPEPVDLMYSELLRSPALQVEGFCRICLRKLKEDQAETLDK
jgi:predicted Zn-dependent protease